VQFPSDVTHATYAANTQRNECKKYATSAADADDATVEKQQ